MRINVFSCMLVAWALTALLMACAEAPAALQPSVEAAASGSLAFNALAPSAGSAADAPMPAAPASNAKSLPAPKTAYEAQYQVQYALDAIGQKLRAGKTEGIDYDLTKARWGVDVIHALAMAEGDRKKRLEISLKQLSARLEKIEQATAKKDFTQAEYEHRNAVAVLKQTLHYLK